MQIPERHPHPHTTSQRKTWFLSFWKKNCLLQGNYWKETQIYADTRSSLITKKIQKYSSDSSDCWRVDNNIYQTEHTLSRETIYTINRRWVWVISTSDAWLLVKSYHRFGVSVIVAVMKIRSEVKWNPFSLEHPIHMIGNLLPQTESELVAKPSHLDLV